MLRQLVRDGYHKDITFEFALRGRMHVLSLSLVCPMSVFGLRHLTHGSGGLVCLLQMVHVVRNRDDVLL